MTGCGPLLSLSSCPSHSVAPVFRRITACVRYGDGSSLEFFQVVHNCLLFVVRHRICSRSVPRLALFLLLPLPLLLHVVLELRRNDFKVRARDEALECALCGLNTAPWWQARRRVAPSVWESSEKGSRKVIRVQRRKMELGIRMSLADAGAGQPDVAAPDKQDISRINVLCLSSCKIVCSDGESKQG